MSPTQPDNLTEAHAAVYDRQLRVWGVEVQRRLMDAKVLLIGLGGLAAEVAKNVVLAGVGTVALRDDTPAAAASPCNYLVEPEGEAGRSVAECSARTLQAMNPLMAVRVEPGPPSVAELLPTGEGGGGGAGAGPQGGSGEMSAEAEALQTLVARYDLVVACGLPLRQVAALDELCRRLGRQLFAGEVRGPTSYVFADLGPKHTYTLKGEVGEKFAEYGSFRQAMSADLAAVNKRTHPLYLVLRACWEFEVSSARPAAGPADVPLVRATAERLAAGTAPGKATSGAAAAQALLPEGLLEGFVCDGGAAAARGADAGLNEVLGELAPVCAVVGGVVANNVLRAVSGVSPPLRNLFCYSYLARDGLGMEECFL